VDDLVGDIDVFHSPFNFNLTHYSPLPSRCPLVVTYHGMPQSPRDMWDRPDMRGIAAWFTAVERRARLVITVSEEAKRQFLEKCGYPASRVRVIPAACSESFGVRLDGKRGDEVLRHYGLSGVKYILYVGAADRNKNLPALAQAFSLLKKAGLGDYRLVLCGAIDRNYLNLQRQLCRGYGESLIFTGEVSQEKLPFLYRHASLFVLPSLQESFGIPLLEAMKSGVPVCASRRGGMPELCGDAALFFDPLDAEDMATQMLRPLQDRGLAEEMVRKGLKRSGDFSWERTAAKTLQVYREAVQ
jgi:glycosyltransferase involved in cell wall biosynthesis